MDEHETRQSQQAEEEGYQHTKAVLAALDRGLTPEQVEAARQAGGTITHAQRVRSCFKSSEGRQHDAWAYEALGPTEPVTPAWRAALNRAGFVIGRLSAPAPEGHTAVIETRNAYGPLEFFVTVRTEGEEQR